MTRRSLAAAIGILLAACLPLPAAEVRVAAAANLRGTIERIAAEYEAQRGHERDGGPVAQVSITFGSTGKLYAQIIQGAPFDLFLGADVEHARRLEADSLIVEDSRFTYALGRLALWSREPRPLDRLIGIDFEHLAIANPRTAPYGRAAREVLVARGLLEQVEPRLVYGEDVGSAFQFVESGAAELGFVPLSLVRQYDPRSERSTAWVVPESLHSPVEQQAVQLTASESARSFLDFVRGSAARAVLEAQGYAAP